MNIYTDGACSGNPGPGGWGVVISTDDDIEMQHISTDDIDVQPLSTKETGGVIGVQPLYGHEAMTTNNRMELRAVIAAMQAVPPGSTFTLHTDSKYVQNGATQWIHRWKKNNWQTSAGTPVKNRDLWQQLDDLQGTHTVTWNWVKGHAGNPMNELADQLARQGAANQ